MALMRFFYYNKNAELVFTSSENSGTLSGAQGMTEW